MARKKKKTMRQRYDAWLDEHPVCSYAIVCGSVALALVGLFLFVTFSGFGSSADFIYNQF
ncbi:MAG: hypothetical protein Q4A07_07920 [Coriobacteriales bacterium]|nr:hypothetical protein [Coriobacteriales bacterium]